MTDRRLLWTSKKRSVILFLPSSLEVRLSDVVSVDKGNILNFIFGGMCIRMRLNSGKVRRIYEGDGKLSEWIAAVREAVSNVGIDDEQPT